MIKKLFYYGKENNKTTILSIILLFFAALLLILPFLFIYQTIYAIVSEQKITTIFVLKEAMAILICLIIQAVLYVKGLSLSHKAAYGTIMNIRVSLQNKMEKLPLGIIESKGVGAFKKIFTDDIDSFEQLLAHAIPEGISNALGTLLVLLGIFSCDWRLGVLVLIIVPLGLIPVMLMYKIGNKGMANYYTASQIMNNTIIEYVNGMEVVKVFNKSGESYKKLKTAVNNYRDYTLKWYRSCWPFMAIYQSFLPYTLLFALPVGSILVMKGIVGVAPFILALCLALGLGAPLLRTISFMSVVPQIRYKIEELEKVLDSPPVKEGQNFYQGKSYDICFEHVFFRYDEKEVLHDINLNIKANTKVLKKFKMAAYYFVMYSFSALIPRLLIPYLPNVINVLFTGVIALFTQFLPGMMMAYFLIVSTTVSEFVAAMDCMHVTKKISMPLSVLFRFFPTIVEEYGHVRDAMMMRDVGSIRNPMKMLEYRMVPFLTSIVSIGNDLSASALTRGLNAPVNRTNVCPIGFTWRDGIAFFVIICCLIIFIFFR